MIAVAFMAMFTALAASAFVVRVRMNAERTRGFASMPPPAQQLEPAIAAGLPPAPPVAVGPELAGEAAPEREVVPVSLITREEARALAEASLDDEDRATVREWRLAAGRDAEAALEQWLHLAHDAKRAVAAERDQLADDWLATQLTRLDRELQRRDCGAVNERLARMRRLLPERQLPPAMNDCAGSVEDR